MLRHLRYILAVLFIFPVASSLKAQLIVSGTVLDSSKINYVENVRVVSSGGLFAITDSLGKYSITTTEADSLTFYYKNKPTQKFAVRSIPDPSRFDISLRIPIRGKYHVMNEVIVFSKSHRQDSLENRESYADIFEYKKPGLSTSITPGGGVGADVDELINIFRFKRNKRLKSFQQRLEMQEQEKYIDYRFNKSGVRRMTGLTGDYLDSFMVWYRPDYQFVRNSDELVFNQYILNASYQFRKLVIVPDAKKED
ncbi:hypothetical protein BH11BAC4_BH11BAC4_03830 [soil metagenome]